MFAIVVSVISRKFDVPTDPRSALTELFELFFVDMPLTVDERNGVVPLA